MELFRNRSGALEAESPSATSPLYWVLGLLSLLPLAIVLPMAPTRIGIGAIAGWIALIWITTSFVRGQFHYVVPMWVAVYPYCYYFFSFPSERPVFTIDRAFIALLVIEMLVVSRRAIAAPLTRDVRISASFWGLYLLVCFLSFAGNALSEALPFYRLLIEGLLMPALLGLYAMRYFPLIKDLQKLHICACTLGLGLCITGLIELTTQIDLFPWNGSEPQFTDTHVRRAGWAFRAADRLIHGGHPYLLLRALFAAAYAASNLPLADDGPQGGRRNLVRGSPAPTESRPGSCFGADCRS